MTNLQKIAGILSITGTVVLTGLVTWNGGTTLKSAENTILDFTARIQGYEDNEHRIVSHVNSLKAQIADLTTQLETAPSQEEITALNLQIAELNSQLESAEIAGETLATRITELEEQITLANTDAANLQTVIDSNTTDAQPMTEEELTALGVSPVEIPVEEPQAPVVPSNPTYTLTTPSATVFTTPISGLNIKFYYTNTTTIKIENITADTITVTHQPGGTTTQVFASNSTTIPSTATSVTIVHRGTTYVVDILR